MFGQKDKVALFMDGSNFSATIKSLKMGIDYANLRGYFSRRETVVRAHYFTAVLPSSPDTRDELRPLLDWLGYNEWDVVTKPTKSYVDDSGKLRIKGNMDVEITANMMLLRDHVNHMVLFSGDGDFSYVVDLVKKSGVRVTVVSSTNTEVAMCSNQLRTAADRFIDLNDMRSEFGRRPRA